MTPSLQITTQYNTGCISCGAFIKAGTKVHWLRGVGSWCLGCVAPQSALKELKALEQRRELGLEPREFGTAPLTLKESCPEKTIAGARCVLGAGHIPADRHQTDDGIVFYR